MHKAEEAQAEAQAALEQYQAQLREARHEAARIREEAREQGAAIIAEMREQAQAEAAPHRRARARRRSRPSASRRSRRCAARWARWPPTWPAASSVSRWRTRRASAASSTGSSPTSRPARSGPRRWLQRSRRQRRDGQAPDAWLVTRGVPRGSAPWRQALDGGADGGRSVDDLFSVAGVLGRQPALRRAADRPVGDGRGARRGLVAALFGSQVSAPAVAVVVASGRRAALGGRARPRRRARAPRCESVVAAADAGGRLDRRRGRAVPLRPRGRPATRSARRALRPRAVSAADKQALVRLAARGQGHPGRGAPGRRPSASPRGTSPSSRVLDEYARSPRSAASQLVAPVRTAAVPLDEEQRQRLAQALGRPVRTRPCTSTSSSTRRSSAASGSRSATRSSTAPSRPPRRRPPTPRRLTASDPRTTRPADHLHRHSSNESSAEQTTGEETPMTELTIRPEEIRDALQTVRRGLQARRRQPRRGRHASPRPATASPASRACPRRMANELLRVRGRHAGHRPEPRHPRDRCRRPR